MIVDTLSRTELNPILLLNNKHPQNLGIKITI